MVYESLKRHEELHIHRLAAGAIAGIIAQTSTYPLDVVRRRMQVRPDQYTGMLQTVVYIVKTEGVRRGLYKGLSMNWFKGPVAVGVSLTTNDYIKDYIASTHRSSHHLREEE